MYSVGATRSERHALRRAPGTGRITKSNLRPSVTCASTLPRLAMPLPDERRPLNIPSGNSEVRPDSPSPAAPVTGDIKRDYWTAIRVSSGTASRASTEPADR